MPLTFVLHLNWFEYAISARKKQNFGDIPVEGLILRAHVLSDKPSASYSLCAVSDYFGTLSGGHYTSYCRPSRGNVWYNCDDRSVSRLRTPVKTSAAYFLFYNSLQHVWVLLLVPMILLFCGVRLEVSGELLGVSGWEGMGDWCLACGGDGGRRFSGRRMWVVECFGPFPILPVPLLSLYFPYPSDQLSPSHASHTPSCPLFPTITTLMHPRPDAESCCSMSHPVAGCWSLP